MNLIQTTIIVACLATAGSLHAQGRSRGGGGGMPPEFHDNIHKLFENPQKLTRTVDLTSDGYVAETTTSDGALTETLRVHVKQMTERLASGRPVRRWDPAFEEFFDHYDDMEHTMTEIDGGLRMVVKGTTPDAIKAAQNHAQVVFDFSSQGEAQMHQPHRTLLDDDGGESNRFRGGPPDARAAELAATFGTRSSELADTLMKTLGGQLKAALEAGGPEAALPVCAAVAIPLTTQTGEKFDGLTVKRVTDRPRNPENKMDELDTAALKHFQASAKSETKVLTHLTTAEDGRTVRFYRPLHINETCLKCHGGRDSMSDNLQTLLDDKYPDDKAHGYKLGELRGLIRVEQKPAAEE